jgi:hypothetical protein
VISIISNIGEFYLNSVNHFLFYLKPGNINGCPTPKKSTDAPTKTNANTTREPKKINKPTK